MATTKSSKTTKRESIICDECGRYGWKDLATRYDYTCPAPRTAWVCSRCTSGETPIEITSSVNIPSMPNRGWERY